MKKRVLSMAIVLATSLSMLNFAPAAQAVTWTTTEDGYKVYEFAKNAVETHEMPAAGLCQAFAWRCLSQSIGVTDNRGGCCAMKAGQTNIISTSRDDIPLGAAVYFAGSRVICSQCGQKAGHVGIYIGNNEISHSWGSNKTITKSTIDHVISCGYKYCGWGWQGGYALATSSDDFAATIQPGLYSLAPMCAPDRRLDVADGATHTGANVQIWRSNDTAAQQWNIESLGGGYYKLVCRESGKVLDVADAKKTSGTNVQQCIWTDNPAQHWRFTDAGDGYYHISPQLNTGLNLDVNEGEDANGANVQIWEKHDKAPQKWKLIPVSQPAKTDHTHQKGTFQFNEAQHPHYGYYQCSLCGVNFTDGSTIQMAGCSTCYPNNAGVADRTAVSGQAIVDYAKQWIGTPYVWGGTSLTNGADCSGFVCRVYEHFGFDLWKRRTGLRRLVDDGVAIELGTDLSQAQPGDIITCNGGKHVVIYAGNDRIVQSTSGKGVCESSARLSNVISMIRINGVSNTAAPQPPQTTTTPETQQTPQVTEYFDCDIYIYTTAGQTVNAYANIFDAKRKNWFDRGQVLRCQKGAKGSDGSTWYQTHAVNARDELVTLWVNAGSPGITIEEIKPEPEPTPTPESTPTPKPDCSNGHTWGSWKTTREASCTGYGERERICSVCGETQEESLAKLEHNYRVSRETDAAVTYTCSWCGNSYTKDKELPKPTAAPEPEPSSAPDIYQDGIFRDVGPNDWFRDNVATVYELGLMKGTGERAFSPTNNVTLAETVTLAARIYSRYYGDGESFAGYDGGNWYDPYVNYARAKGIISANYAYAHPATREEFVFILAQALPAEALKQTVGEVRFADAADIIYAGAVELLAGAGVINGVPENGLTYFKPGATITRAEVAAIVGRMAQPETRVGK